MTPAWHDDFLAVYPYLIKRLQSIPNLKAVLESKDLDALTRDKKLLPHDGAVYLVFDGFTPNTDNNNRREQSFELSFSVILVKRQHSPSPDLDSIGRQLTQITKALLGFDPVDEHGKALCAKPFKAAKAMPVQYFDGFGFFPMRFVSEVSVLVSS